MYSKGMNFSTNWFESDIVKKANEELSCVVSKLKDPSFLSKDGEGNPCLSVGGVGGNDSKIKMLSVKFKEKGSSELRKALESLGWKKIRRESPSSAFWYSGEKSREYYLVYEKTIRYFKYAIYKSKAGLHSMDYIDSIYDPRLQDIIGGYLVKAADLPIVVNAMGGRSHFEEEYEKGFVKIVELPEGEEPLTREDRYPKNSEKFFYGWIAPNGDTYACSFEEHNDSADEIAKELGMRYRDGGTRALEEAGFLKIARPAPYTAENLGKRTAYMSFWSKKEMTSSQADTIMREGIYDEDWQTRELVDKQFSERDR